MAMVELFREHNKQWAKIPMSVDSVPYTDEFEYLHREFKRLIDPIVGRNDVWKLLLRCRKAGKLT
jgi:virulence-associated protein VagC